MLCLGLHSVEKTFIDSGMVEFSFYSQFRVILSGCAEGPFFLNLVYNVRDKPLY